jgi:hypothetical protein
MEERSDWEERKEQYRREWDERHSAHGETWAENEASYRYGYERASSPEFSGRAFDEAEPDLRRDWEGQYADTPWEKAKHAIQDAWESVIGGAPSRR